jgi:hypothetical protein
VAYLILMQSHALWQSPTLVPDRWKHIYYPFVSLFPAEWIRPGLANDLGFLAAGLFAILICGLFLVYFLLLRRFLDAEIAPDEALGALRRIVAFTVVALAILFVVPGVLSSDLFSYVWYGRVFALFAENPFTHVPADYAWRDTGRWLQWVYWRETPSVYGPIWVFLAGGVAKASQLLDGNIVTHLLGHKLLASVAHLVNVVLVWRIVGNLTKLESGIWNPDRTTSAQVAATVAYAWNPLLLIEFGANGHNDVLMMTFVLTSVWLHLTGRWRLAVAALACAALVKLIAVVFLPGYLWLLFWQSHQGGALESLRKRLWIGAQATMVFATTFLVFYLPFWQGLSTLRPLITGPPVELYINSLGWLLRFKVPEVASAVADLLNLSPPEFWTTRAVGQRLEWPVRFGATLITGAFALVTTWKARDLPRMITAWGWVLFVYLTVGAVWFWPWYVSWLVVIAVIAGPGRLFNATLILCLTSLLMYATLWRSDPVVSEIFAWRDAAVMLPPLVYALASSWRDSRTRPGQPAPAPVPEPRFRHVDARPPSVPVPLMPETYRAALLPSPVEESPPPAWEVADAPTTHLYDP